MSGAGSRRLLGLILASITLLLLAHVAAAIREAPPDAEYLWDFRLYYFSACADARGLDAYLPSAVSTLADRPVTLIYCYLGPTLWMWRPFTLLPYETAATVYLVVTTGAAVVLPLLWQRVFLGDAGSWAFYPFCLLAYGCTLLTGIATGNAVWLEQLLLWLGLACFVRGRCVPFTVLVVLAALLKMTTLVFLVLLVLPPTRERLLCLCGGLAAFGAALWACWWFDAARWDGWVRNVGMLAGERGAVNPALWPAVRDALQQLGLASPSPLARAVYGLAVAAVLVVSWRAWRRVADGCDGETRAVRTVFLVIMTLALVSPRFKDYAYVLLLAPTWFVLTRAPRDTAAALLVIAASLPLSSSLPITRTLSAFLVEYAPLWVAMGVWAALCALPLEDASLQSRYNCADLPHDSQVR